MNRRKAISYLGLGAGGVILSSKNALASNVSILKKHEIRFL